MITYVYVEFQSDRFLNMRLLHVKKFTKCICIMHICVMHMNGKTFKSRIMVGKNILKFSATVDF